MQPQNVDHLKSLRSSLRKIKNIPRIVNDFERYTLTLQDWTALVEFLNQLLEILSTSSKLLDFEKTSLYAVLQSVFPIETINLISTKITSTISLEKSSLLDRVIIQRGINKDLDDAYETYDNIEDLLVLETNKICQNFPELKDSFNALYFPQLGYLVTVTKEYTDAVEQHESFQICQWSLVFSTETFSYYKTVETKDMDARYGDIFGLICDYELEIAQALQESLMEYSKMFIDTCNIIAQLDCHQALAWAAIQNGYTRPTMTTDRSLVIKQGYHPLYVKLVSSFIPNSISLSYETTDKPNDSDQTQPANLLLVTGANYSGKTVYLTQNALIVFMAQIGSFVPAQSARIGIVDRILTRLTTRESVSRNKSSFMNDLEQVSFIFRMMTPRSLLIVDEFGKGTETKDGAALFGALVRYFQNLGPLSPKVLASTHFHELLEQDVIHKEKGLYLCHMEILINDNLEAATDMRFQESVESISYLYRVRPGKASLSFGICCAKLCGVDPDIIALAEKIYQEKMSGGNFSTFFLQCSPEEQQRMKRAGRVIKQFVKTDLEKLQNAKMYLKNLIQLGEEWHGYNGGLGCF